MEFTGLGSIGATQVSSPTLPGVTGWRRHQVQGGGAELIQFAQAVTMKLRVMHFLEASENPESWPRKD